MISALVVSMSLTAVAVPPGQEVVNHAHPGHYAQPTLRSFERRPVDEDRRAAWLAYCRELELLWEEYRAAGSTPSAWRQYLSQAGQAKRRYVFGDPYLAPIIDPYHP
jgi:hypothetical protein